MSWYEADEALGVAEPAQARGGTLGEAAFEYAAQRPTHLGEFRWACQECGETVAGRGPSGRNRPGTRPGTARAASAPGGRRRRMACRGRLTASRSPHHT